jgi:tetratricopeptide (TPR) repeat protein
MERHEFKGEAEAQKYMNRLLGKGLEKELARLPELSPKERAQEMAYEAMDQTSAKRALDLAKRALELDPDCADAYYVIALHTARTPARKIELFEKGMAAAERSLGGDFFRENRGHFWGMIQSRPYMRARLELALGHHAAGNLDVAIGHMEEMLELNPDDNQGVREILLGCYLEKTDLDGARRLLEKFNEDASGLFEWARVIERFLAGDTAGAEKQRQVAHRANPYAASYLAILKPVPNRLPDFYGLGDENEAVHIACWLLPAMLTHPQAMHWLRQKSSTAGRGPAQKDRTARRKTGGAYSDATTRIPRQIPLIDMAERGEDGAKAAAGPQAHTLMSNEAVARMYGPDPEQMANPASAGYQAQQLVIQALTSETLADTIELARRAVELDPNCLDARVILAKTTGKTARKRIDALEAVVIAGEETLGKAFLEEHLGHLWEQADARPYMRACQELALSLLSESKDPLEGVEEMEHLLSLDDTDPLGARDVLLGFYLATDDLEGAELLLKTFPEDQGAVFIWGRVLFAYLSGNRAGAVSLLEEARRVCPAPEDYLSGAKELTEPVLDPFVKPEEAQAMMCMIWLGGSWTANPEAMEWLASQPRVRLS